MPHSIGKVRTPVAKRAALALSPTVNMPEGMRRFLGIPVAKRVALTFSPTVNMPSAC
jgi:hypothetical protein